MSLTLPSKRLRTDAAAATEWGNEGGIRGFPEMTCGYEVRVLGLAVPTPSELRSFRWLFRVWMKLKSCFFADDILNRSS